MRISVCIPYVCLGAYEPLKVFLGATDPAHTPLWKKICAGATSGML